MTRANQPLNQVKKRPGGRWPCFSISTHSAGDSVSATRPEMTTADRDRHGELPVELAGQAAEEGDRHEHRAQRQHDRDDRSGHLVHRLDRGVARRQLVLAHVALDVLQHDDRVVDDDADREHHAEQRQRVDRVAEHVEAGERPDQRNRHRDERDDRGAPALQEEIDDEEDEQHRLGERLHDLGDRHFDEARRVVRDRVGEALRELLRERGGARPDRLRDARAHWRPGERKMPISAASWPL